MSVSCERCGKIVAFAESEKAAKLEDHRLWNHPTDDEVWECWVDINQAFRDLRQIAVNQGHTEALVEPMAALSDLLLRYRRYMRNGQRNLEDRKGETA